jgi:hypothetical protein
MTNVDETQADQSEKQTVSDDETCVANISFRMKSIDRVSKLPVIEEIMKLTTNMYGKFRVSVYHVNTVRRQFRKWNYCTATSFVDIHLFICEYILTGVL